MVTVILGGFARDCEPTFFNDWAAGTDLTEDANREDGKRYDWYSD